MKKSVILILLIYFSIPAAAQLNGFTLTGNPQSTNGATWTYQDSVDGIWYDLQGILFQPPNSTGLLPAVIINHGTGGNVNGYSRNIAQRMVDWGFVCIAANLCHSSGVPIGSPGDTSFANLGASTNNYLRDMRCWAILESLGYVDTNCIMSFGHSRGAYTTTGLVATYPDKFACAGHTAGGAISQSGYSAPTTTLAAQITCPYIIHHGDADSVVPVMYDSTLNDVFNTTGITHQFYVYPGLNHPQMSMDSLMFIRTQSWFLAHTCSPVSVTEIESEQLLVYPNPAFDNVTIKSGDNEEHDIELINISGQKIYSSRMKSEITFNISVYSKGIYFLILKNENKIMLKKLIF